MEPEANQEFMKQYDLFFGLIKKVVIDSYVHPFCLYFPAPVIAAACILFGARFYSINDHKISRDVTMKGSEFLAKHGLKSFIQIDLRLEDSTDKQVFPDSLFRENNSNWLKLVLSQSRQANEHISTVDVIWLANQIAD